MEASVLRKRALVPAVGTAVSFLIIHLGLFALFLHYGVMPMARFNIFSILFYIGCFFLIRKGLMRSFVLLTYVEVLLHMFLAIWFVGWDCGFQVSLIGMTITAYFAEYAGRVLEMKPVYGLPLCILGLVTYLASFIVTRGRTAPYAFPEQVAFWLQIGWAAMTFLIDMFFLQIFVLQAARAEEKLTEQVLHDKLTGLLTRYFMADYLKKAAASEDGRLYWIAMADIDDFKQINDSCGHNCGDYVLEKMAEIFRESFPDLEICRWGGEEFLIVGKAEDPAAVPTGRLEALRRRVEEGEFSYDGKALHPTITIGMAFYEGDGVKNWIERADEKLYQGKHRGKNRVVA